MKKLQVLGTGCPKCKKMAEAVELAAKASGVEYELIKVTDINEILTFGAMMMPALAVDGVLKISGRIPSADELKKMIV